MADFLPPINKINISYLWKFFIIRLQAVKIILVFCEICLFDHTWVITMFNLHQNDTIICQ